jgi:hypothetical protein
MINRVPMMKTLIPFLSLFLASCGVHNHRYDSEQDAYYQNDYYAYDNYDPYYGYGSSGYSTTGDGVYYNDYNYYPDRWGVNYSNVYYSPYRYPRVGFYFSSGYGCGYSYWSNGCSSRYWPSSYYVYNSWPSYGFGFSYSSYYYDNNWWYNHWRHRNYEHYRPTQTGFYSARNEALRLNNSRYYNSHKYNQRNNRYNNTYRNNPTAVNRGRSSSNRPVNRSNNRTNNSNKPSRAAKPVQRGRQEAVQNNQRYNQIRANDSVRSQATARSSSQGLQSRINEDYVQRNYQNNRYQSQKPTQTASNSSMQTNRVKPMNSQSPVYQTNTVPRTNSNAIRYNQRPTNNLNHVAPRAEQRQLNTRNQSNSRSVQSGSIQAPSNQALVKPSQPVNKPKPRSRTKNTEKTKDTRSNDNRSSSSGSRGRSGNRD